MSPRWQATTPADAQILSDLRAGNEQSYAALYRKYWGPLRKYAARLTRSPDEAADLVHDVLVNLFAHRETVCVLSSLEAYLFCAVRNRASNARRQRRIHERWVQSELDEHEGTNAFTMRDETAVEYGSAQHEAAQMLNSLPSRCRETVQLVYVEGLSYDEAAARLGVARSTIHTHILHARRLGRQKRHPAAPDHSARR